MLISGFGLCQEFELTKEKVDSLMKTIVPEIEKASGQSFPKPPDVRICTIDDLKKVIHDEFAIQPVMLNMFKGKSKEDLEDSLDSTAEGFASMVFGKYGFNTKVVYVLPGNFKALMNGMKIPEDKYELMAKYILTHETCHLLCDAIYDASAHLTKLSEVDQGMAFNAIFEGYADFIAEKVLLDMKVTAEDIKLVMDRDFAKQTVDLLFKSLYKDGRNFVKKIVEKEGDGILKEAFKRPPSRTDYIYFPERYIAFLKGKEVVEPKTDFEKLFLQFDSAYSKDKGWTKQLTDFGALQLNAILKEANLKEEEHQAFISKLCEGKAAIFSNDDSKSAAIVGVLRFKDSESANNFIDVEEKVLVNRKKTVTKSGGKIKDVLLEKKQTEDGYSVLLRRNLTAGGQDLHTFIYVVARGVWLIEIDLLAKSDEALYSSFGKKNDDESIKETVKEIYTKIFKTLLD